MVEELDLWSVIEEAKSIALPSVAAMDEEEKKCPVKESAVDRM